MLAADEASVIAPESANGSLQKLLVWSHFSPTLRHREQAAYCGLVVVLANEIYHRERGVFPPSEEALVGTYLESLPDDGSAELDDRTTPTVVDSRVWAQPPP
jgi:hypothetical protein